MKILIDQNISFRIIARIQQAFPNMAHVKSLNLTDENDYKISYSLVKMLLMPF